MPKRVVPVCVGIDKKERLISQSHNFHLQQKYKDKQVVENHLPSPWSGVLLCVLLSCLGAPRAKGESAVRHKVTC